MALPRSVEPKVPLEFQVIGHLWPAPAEFCRYFHIAGQLVGCRQVVFLRIIHVAQLALPHVVRHWGGVTGQGQQIEAVARVRRDHPGSLAVFSWYFNQLLKISSGT